jgi:hypothetical protein
MLHGPAQWGNVEAITTMLTEKVIQGEWLWWLRCLWCHSAVDDRLRYLFALPFKSMFCRYCSDPLHVLLVTAVGA